MGHIISEIFPFLGSVFAHWQIWLSGGGLGGLIVIAIALREKFWGISLSKRAYAYIFLITFFLCACFMSWVDKDDAFNKLNKEKTDLLNQDQSNLKLLQNKYDALNAQCEYKDGVVDTLGKQNRDQQNTINNCQTQALKLITPTPWQYTTLPLNPFPPNNSKKWISYVSVSNKTVTPFFMDVKCDQPISDPQGYVLNNQFMGYGGAMNADGKGFNFAISFPAWGPNSPIAIQFSYVGEKIPVCTFNAR